MGDDGNGYVFPTVVQQPDKSLKYLGASAEDYAHQTNTGIQFPKEQGSWFAANGYKQGTGVLPGSLTQHAMGGEFSGETTERDMSMWNRKVWNGEYAKGGWISKAVNPKHVGFCTPMTKSTCTPRRKAFAQTMKAHHGFH